MSRTASAARATSSCSSSIPFPPVQIRGVIADAVFGNFPDITVIDRVTPDVSDGGIADSRAKMEAILAANPEPGSIAAVWAAWDQPALGALQAIEAAGREGEGIVITGIDANPQARDAIAAGGNFEASVAQDFAGIGATTADTVQRLLNGEELAAAGDLRARPSSSPRPTSGPSEGAQPCAELRLEGLSRRFGQVQALDGVSLSCAGARSTR
jgi:ABC-type sugar transport system substrate-binding protein